MSIDTKVPVFTLNNTQESELSLPKVFDTKIRPDLILFAYKNMRMNRRQPYAVNWQAGKRSSAKSWGTGRAKARVPRVKASGTRRSGQGAEANFCRGGRLSSPTTVQRKWQRQTPRSLRRLTAAMGVAATSNVSLVEARGHRVAEVKSLPIIVTERVRELKKTSEAVKLLENLGLSAELERASEKKIRPGKGKARNRKYKTKQGVLLIHNDKPENLKAFRNISGLDTISVDELSVLSLCPGGQAGRLVVWTDAAFSKLNGIFGSEEVESEKSGFSLADDVVVEENVEEIFYSGEVQSFLDVEGLLSIPQVYRREQIIQLNPQYEAVKFN